MNNILVSLYHTYRNYSLNNFQLHLTDHHLKFVYHLYLNYISIHLHRFNSLH